ncbi:MarR family winged helix-turn-helix transcriptional regulator [Pseudomonas typographi]|uniref:MarR family transcriptional regulator n=1 Tax=Pseudomonas typographi TaxID=2715964 RepID=A0ABR7Z715_9PSED|nr:MarR family transcriptional regulator [Pseudomonas typographi]MBD1551126.1 MarR family transcriptional regulator [Pseudomonas typographi]MBD1586380.1 MarR family transcriptional regulator [Pseudomonas typographi]MBD1601339.1 MarR family transcriptional regulator [Pseudomonas typographi]
MNIPKKRRNRYDPASDEFCKEEFPFYWLARVHGRYTQSMERVLKKIDLDIPRWRVLWILKENGESSISEISTHAIAKLSTITKIVYRMKDDGLVDTATSTEDGRVTRVCITAHGLANIERMQGATRELFKRSFTGLTEAQIQRLSRLLETVFHNLEDF